MKELSNPESLYKVLDLMDEYVGIKRRYELVMAVNINGMVFLSSPIG